MKRFFIAVSILLLAMLSFAQSDSLKKPTPVQWARERKIDVKHIALNLQFDWKNRQAFGTAAISLSPFQATDNISLDAGILTINSISLNEASLKFDYDGGDKNDGLKIALDRTYQRDDLITITIAYRTNWFNDADPNNVGGSFGKGIRFIEPTPTEPKRLKQIWSVGDPESNRYWFPCYDYPNDLRTTEFTATVEKDLTVISNGNLIEAKNNTDGTKTFHWKMDVPYANHLTSFVVGEYSDIQQNYNNIELHSYCYAHETEATEATIDRLPDMIKYFSEKTGVQYPYTRYSQVFVQDFGGLMGNSMASTITENMVDDYRTHVDFLYLWDVTEAEALAHQWFGSYTTPRDWSHTWLDKAFSHYFSGLYNEYKNGRDEFLLWQHFYHQGIYQSDWDAGFYFPVVNKNYETAVEFTASNYPYSRGFIALHMLRKHLGDEAWWKAINIYLKSNGNKTVSTEDFRKAVEEASGEPMDWFFDQWIYKTGHPIFSVTKTYDAAKKQLSLIVNQTQQNISTNPFSQTEFFKGKVDVEIDGKVQQFWIEAKKQNVFVIASSQNPSFVNFDFEGTWIKEIIFEKTFDELISQLLNSKDALARVDAMTRLVTIGLDSATSSQNKEKIYAAFRTVITSDSYWRVRLNALSRLQRLLAPSWTKTPVSLNKETTAMLLSVIKKDKAWVRSTAIQFLGMTRHARYADIYLNALTDESDRVINSAAIALGRSKSPKAFDALAKLVNKPSWKNQSLMSSLVGLKELGDPRGYTIAFNALSDLTLARWTLPTPPSIWDFRVFAVQTIVSLGKGSEAFPLIYDRLKKSLIENDTHVIFNNAFLIANLADSRGLEAFNLLKVKYKDDANAMAAINQFETQLQESLKNP